MPSWVWTNIYSDIKKGLVNKGKLSLFILLKKLILYFGTTCRAILTKKS